MAKSNERPPWAPPETDLRAITRRADTCPTTIYLCDYLGHERWKWLIFGEVKFQQRARSPRWYIMAYLTEGVTDFEHDSAYALQLPVIALTFDNLWYHYDGITAIFSAVVDPLHDEQDAEMGSITKSEFAVPDPGYNPMEHPEASTCKSKHCGEPHIIIPQGFYVPPANPELHSAVAGRYIKIYVGPTLREKS